MNDQKRDNFELYRDLIDAAAATFANAEALYSEAGILLSAGAVARALLLHQISLEECAKVQLLSSAAFSAASGLPFNERKFRRSLRDHGAKNDINGYSLPPSHEEALAIDARDQIAAVKAAAEVRQKFHHHSNDLKNAALYVDVGAGTVSTPQDSISLSMVEEIEVRNRTFLSIAFRHVEMLQRRRDDPAAAATEAANLRETVEAMVAGGIDRVDDLLASLQELSRPNSKA